MLEQQIAGSDRRRPGESRNEPGDGGAGDRCHPEFYVRPELQGFGAPTAGRHLAFALSCINAAVVLPGGAVGSGRDALRG